MKSTSLKQPVESDWVIKPTADEVALFAKDIIIKVAKQAIENHGCFKIVLAGGTTPKKVYQLLSKESCDWKYWQLYLGDERCLPVGDTERNSQMVENTLLKHIEVPKQNIHFIRAEKGSNKAAISYAKEVEKALPFDLVMLGMGEDGHTASLFPNHQHNLEEWVHAVANAPKPPVDRVSLSVHALSETRVLLMLITGASKKNSVLRWKQGAKLPISQIKTREKAIILLDSSAWSR